MEYAKIATAENNTAHNGLTDQLDWKIAHNLRKSIKRLTRNNCIKM